MKQLGKKNGFWVLAAAIAAGGALLAVSAPAAAQPLPVGAPSAPVNIAPSGNVALQGKADPSRSKGRVSGVKASPGKGPKVTDMLVKPADVRPLPKGYLTVTKDYNADDAASGLVAARRALGEGRYDAALQLFEGLYAKNPHDKRVLVGRAVAMQKLGMNTQALSAYEEALTNDPKNLEALTNMLGLLEKQDRSVAIEKLSELQGVYPANADIAAQLGTAYGSASDYQQALKYLNIADDLRPGSVQIIFNKAVVYDRMGEKQKAVDLYKRVIQIAKNNDTEQNPLVDTVKERLSTIQ